MNTIAGIDLGTTFSALARLNGIGRPEIVPNSEGERITPSAVYFDDEEAGAIRVGLEAVNCRQLNPDVRYAGSNGISGIPTGKNPSMGKTGRRRRFPV